MANTFCHKIAMRLVAFAMLGGRPIKIITGKVSNDPPPPTTLRKPATMPSPINSRLEVKSSEYDCT